MARKKTHVNDIDPDILFVNSGASVMVRCDIGAIQTHTRLFNKGSSPIDVMFLDKRGQGGARVNLGRIVGLIDNEPEQRGSRVSLAMSMPA